MRLVKSVTGKIVVLIFVALGLLTVAGVLLTMAYGPKKPSSLAIAIDNATVASSPFTKFRAMDLRIGKDCKPVLVASSEAQRTQGLREVMSLKPYKGMLFAFDADTSARFTMADTKMPIDITFYDGDGKPVGTERMVPCAGTDATCPLYGPDKAYRYALETEQGQMFSGAISTCS